MHPIMIFVRLSQTTLYDNEGDDPTWDKIKQQYYCRKPGESAITPLP